MDMGMGMDMDIALVHWMEGIKYIQRVENELVLMHLLST